MGVIRVEHNEHYTTMSNYHLQDRRLSLRAMGLMSKMLSLPDDWDYTVSGLAAICKEGRDAVRRALQELEAAGYLIREQGRSGGNFAANNYTLYEEPQLEGPPLTENPSTEKPSTVKPSTEKPSAEKPLTGFPTQQNNLYNKKTNKQKQKRVTDWEPEMFERFWACYPCRKDKAAARQEWNKLKPDRKLMDEMSAALHRAKASDEWQRGIGIPYACRWLSHRRWEDESDRHPDDAPEEVIGWR